MKTTLWITAALLVTSTLNAQQSTTRNIAIVELGQDPGPPGEVRAAGPVSGRIAVVRSSKCSACHQQDPAIDPGGDLSLYLANGLPGYHSLKLTGGTGVANRTLPVLAEPPEDHSRKLLNLPNDSGLVIKSTCPKSTDHLVGLQVHDVVLTANDQPVRTFRQLDALFAEDKPLEIVVLRKGEQVRLQRPPSSKQKKSVYRLGIQLGTIEEVVRHQLELDSTVNVIVTGIQEGSPASSADVQAYDIILKVDGMPVPDAETLQKAVAASKGQQIALTLLRAGRERTVELAAEKVDADPFAGAAAEHSLLLFDRDIQSFADPLEAVARISVAPPSEHALIQEIKSLRRDVEELTTLIRQLSETNARNGEQR